MRIIDIDPESLIDASRRFNCAIIDYGGSTLLFYRYEIGGDYKSDLAYCELDCHYNVIKDTNKRWQALRHSAKVQTVDDPRAFLHKGELYLQHNQGAVFNTPGNNWVWCTGVVFSQIDLRGGATLSSKLPDIGKNLNRATTVDRKNIDTEKNWMPLSDGRSLYLIYKLNPLEVYLYDYPTNSHKLQSKTEIDQSFWKWGDFLAGSTPFIPYKGDYIGLFHSYTYPHADNPNKRVYHIGAVVVSVEGQDFRIKAISKEPLITSEHDEKQDLRNINHGWRPNVIFPCGFIQRGNKFVISAGWQDCLCKIYELDEKEIEDNIDPIETLTKIERKTEPCLDSTLQELE